MNILQGLDEHMDYISAASGLCLSIPERIKLETTLDKLKEEYKCEEMLFWGKIMGIEKDYYIALGLYYKEHKDFPLKKFFFASSTNFLFSELPEIQEHHIPDFQKFNSYFIGNPDIILIKYDTATQLNVYDADEQISNGTFTPKLRRKNLTESDRLSYIVRSIDNDTNIIPVGGMKMLPIREMRRNDLFSGLTCDEIGEIGKYMHFRKPQYQNKIDLIAMGKATFDFNFLDNIQDTPIKNCWSVQINSSKTVSSIRSLLWPGYYAYHKANTDMFGGVYFGYGIRNVDIAFMQQ
jgi:radial spoke head protein 9